MFKVAMWESVLVVAGRGWLAIVIILMINKMINVKYQDLNNLFGKKIEDVEVQSLLSGLEKVVIKKPNDGQQFVIAKNYGFDLIFQPLTGMQGGRTKELRVLTTIFLFNDGVSKHTRFEDVPYGFDFNLNREEILKKFPAPSETVSRAGLVVDKWKAGLIDKPTIFAVYGADTGKISYLNIAQS